MTARVRTHASPGVTAARQHIPPVTGQTRLPWWAAALPVLAFALLLALLLGGGEAAAAEQQAGGEALAALLERVEQALLG
ncbi:hypothetical protein [Streptomyces albidus (ex Kaewkla and Franco 2022)]|uniref:hypothetical protein n=1 Tax=Streptomyces albidus (ex Kaewkla and Franco 2022) TaxID=722709 RepID=UPI001B3571BA|nr:hypothetical protein [Streptomyces albidus (ex Kaewkla and Franco 2022)]